MRGAKGPDHFAQPRVRANGFQPQFVDRFAATLATDRLVLRPLLAADAPRVRDLAGADAIASTIPHLPHPYELHHAETWIEGHAAAFDEGTTLELGIHAREEDGLVGAVALHLAPPHERADLGYWIGTPFWGRGYAREAAGAMLRHGFDTLGLHRVHAHHLTRNRASGRVLRRIGIALAPLVVTLGGFLAYRAYIQQRILEESAPGRPPQAPVVWWCGGVLARSTSEGPTAASWTTVGEGAPRLAATRVVSLRYPELP